MLIWEVLRQGEEGKCQHNSAKDTAESEQIRSKKVTNMGQMWRGQWARKRPFGFRKSFQDNGLEAFLVNFSGKIS
jgi:hypothetical protein